MDPKPQVGISEYALFNDNPIFYTDWMGDSLVKIFFENHGGYIKGQNYVMVDKNIADKVEELIRYAVSNKISIRINSSFRSTEEQERIQKTGITPARPGTSRHEAGFAIDFNLYDEKGNIIRKNETVTAEHPFIKKALNLGFRWGGNFRPQPDKVHIDMWAPSEKSKFGYSSFEEARKENQELYKRGIYDVKVIDFGAGNDKENQNEGNEK